MKKILLLLVAGLMAVSCKTQGTIAKSTQGTRQANKVIKGEWTLSSITYNEKGKYEKMVKANIQNCIECGACEFVCPSRVPLMESIKTGKLILSEMEEKK